ncbi:hypothetical protein JW899_00810 [Candidatus Uhrbacteria bacterium]|nr:hypothetical protein [Candidatus Uhrbacteria bacterium]
MNKLLTKKIAVGAAMAAAMLPIVAMAQGPDLGLEYATATGLTSTDVRTTISMLINAFMGLLGIVAVCLILFGGFKWMMAAGNTERVEEAKKLMISGVIGLIIIMTSYSIAQFVIGAIQKGTSGEI